MMLGPVWCFLFGHRYSKLGFNWLNQAVLSCSRCGKRRLG